MARVGRERVQARGRLVSIVLLVTLMFGLAACDTNPVAAPPPVSGQAQGNLEAPAARRTKLERKIGQMIMVGFSGSEPDPSLPIVRQIRAGQVGGVVLYDVDPLTGQAGGNVRSADQLRRLVRGLRGLDQDVLLVGVDEEGGQARMLKERHGFPPSLSQQRLGEQGSAQRTREQAERTASTLLDLGINLNFAPVVDVNRNPSSPAIGAKGRSFSADARVVTDHARAVIQAHRQQGVLTTLKHFPGHGSARADSHRGFVDVSDTWSDVELEPYRTLIGEGLADAVMTAHVFNRHLDPNWPATLSPAVITDLLRGKLGFDGVVMTDDLQMGAITERYGLETAVRQAIVAGDDLLLFANNSAQTYDPELAPRVVRIIASLVDNGSISEARIDQSVRRIQTLKARVRQSPAAAPGR